MQKAMVRLAGVVQRRRGLVLAAWLLLPLDVDAKRDEALDAARELREELDVGEAIAGVQP